MFLLSAKYIFFSWVSETRVLNHMLHTCGGIPSGPFIPVDHSLQHQCATKYWLKIAGLRNRYNNSSPDASGMKQVFIQPFMSHFSFTLWILTKLALMTVSM